MVGELDFGPSDGTEVGLSVVGGSFAGEAAHVEERNSVALAALDTAAAQPIPVHTWHVIAAYLAVRASAVLVDCSADKLCGEGILTAHIPSQWGRWALATSPWTDSSAPLTLEASSAPVILLTFAVALVSGHGTPACAGRSAAPESVESAPSKLSTEGLLVRETAALHFALFK